MRHAAAIMAAESYAALEPEISMIEAQIATLSARGVIARFWRYDTDPIQEPQPIEYKRVGLMQGVHVQPTGPRTGFGDFLSRCAMAGKPVSLIKTVNDGGALAEAKSYCRDTVTVWRSKVQYDAGDDLDFPPGDWQWRMDQARSIADLWMTKLVERWRLDRGVTDYLEICNEPNGSTPYQFEAQAAWTQACMEWADARGIKCAVYGFSSGCPEPWQMDILLPTFKHAAEHGHALAVHDGSVNGDRPLFQQAAQDGTAFRYRLIADKMAERGWPMPPLVITECYWWRYQWDDMAWYLRELARDPYVLGMAWFTVGDFGTQNVAGQLGHFADLIERM